jgi:nucleotidyltransferase substrate binding protein (TIGR01987 family)
MAPRVFQLAGEVLEVGNMANRHDVRWKQRFQNFDKALAVLLRTASIIDMSEAERGGLIHYFEVSFELAWKVLKDVLEEEGIKGLTGPRTIIKLAYENALIADGYAWMEALEDRNLTTHTYDMETALRAEAAIRDTYIPFLERLYHDFNKRLSA